MSDKLATNMIFWRSVICAIRIIYRNGSVVVHFELILSSTSNTTKQELKDVLLAANGTNKHNLIFSNIILNGKLMSTSWFVRQH